MNLSDMTLQELKDYQKWHEDAAKLALADLDFSSANILNEQARKAAEEIALREKKGRRQE